MNKDLGKKFEVSVEKLRWNCDFNQFRFKSTGDVAPIQDFIGQKRAIEAIEFGLSLDKPGYNIFVTGLAGTGKMSVIKSYLERFIERKTKEKAPELKDWCYVYNFSSPDKPTIISLPNGQGKVFKNEVEQLLQILKREISKAFSGKEYEEQRREILDRSQATREKLFQEAEKVAKALGFELRPTPLGIIALPADKEGKVITRQKYIELPQEERKEIDNRQTKVMEDVKEAAEKARESERRADEQVVSLDRKIVEFVVKPLFDTLLRKYAAIEDVKRFLEGAFIFVMDNIDLLRCEGEEKNPLVVSLGAEGVTGRERSFNLAFQINIFIDNSETKGLPIIIETHPTFGNLFGKLERRAFMGTYYSDHTLLKPGALALANGGYLILNARDVLLNPGVWEGLKRAIKNKESRVEEPWEFYGFVIPSGLRPEPLPIEVKVIIVGDSFLFQLLSIVDEDFWEMFKIRGDFDFQIDKTPETMDAYAALIADICRKENLFHFDSSGVAKVIEYGSRIVADQNKLSSRFGFIRDLLIEANQWAKNNNKELVGKAEVQQALDAKVYRSDLVAERIREYMRDGIIMVDTEGAIVGQVNGLSIFTVGDVSFGKPSRITARTFLGRRGVINIERETQLSGRIHDKGVLILAGYLGWKYAQDKPLPLSASLCFEQSYEGVEGDSASAPELYAILSSLAEVPLRQDIAVTGSVNQKGEIQPVGQVNQKIEGFFDLCKVKGFTGEQGVILPKQNLRNLMLREDVVEAVKDGKFHLWAISNIEEGMGILTGITMGEKDKEGRYPDGTLNARIENKLQKFAETLKTIPPESSEK
ncbi:MAG TPA: AAA family ATPase [Bdellovibrionota bacterium]|nr:AAA family ATPase [Bdellovibrionota bacterium]